MFHVVLYEPEIPPNTGNIIRLCANTGVFLHLVHPLGFSLDDSKLRRAGLDYTEWAQISEHESIDAFIDAANPKRLLAFSARAIRCYTDVRYGPCDALVFGPETRGLPQELLQRISARHRLRIPMKPGSRCLNLSNAVAIATYEAWRQVRFVERTALIE